MRGVKNSSSACSAPSCRKRSRAKRLCVKHYAKLRKTGTLETVVGTDAWRARLKTSHAHLRSELSQIDNIEDRRRGQRGSLAAKIASQIKTDAVKAGYFWALTPVETYRLFIGACVYCGAESKWPSGRNGIDRVDSSIGYVPSNCVSSCSHCNRAKGARSVEEFKAWAARLYIVMCRL